MAKKARKSREKFTATAADLVTLATGEGPVVKLLDSVQKDARALFESLNRLKQAGWRDALPDGLDMNRFVDELATLGSAHARISPRVFDGRNAFFVMDQLGILGRPKKKRGRKEKLPDVLPALLANKERAELEEHDRTGRELTDTEYAQREALKERGVRSTDELSKKDAIQFDRDVARMCQYISRARKARDKLE